jgi:hypothetical protein
MPTEPGDAMYVGEGKVTDIIEWFCNNSSARLLGVFVGGSPKYDKFINDVLRKSLAIDVISGSKIDLFLFGTGRRINFLREKSRDATISALPLTELHQNSENNHGHMSSNRSVVEPRKIANASATASTDVKDALGLRTDQLPCLALIRKD